MFAYTIKKKFQVMQFHSAKQQYDVRFFGAKHSRATINAKFIKPIDTPISEIKTKKYGFQKAMNELLDHQSLIAQRTYRVDEHSEINVKRRQRKSSNTLKSNTISSLDGVGYINNRRKTVVERIIKRPRKSLNEPVRDNDPSYINPKSVGSTCDSERPSKVVNRSAWDEQDPVLTKKVSKRRKTGDIESLSTPITQYIERKKVTSRRITRAVSRAHCITDSDSRENR